ncbi:Fic family protein [Williamsia sp. CHRR-6]|uniref:Fic/DOC family protein n=1 Tax=Williamsia sp. CHRR-6 TaxID=2835871 RepID=UPI001BDB1A4B|nr:Fic family protein [Williamsia sp. CHRR-6]MBT0568599.1 Fic family protein [Williamsia sp. CHRR-6]
MTTSSSSGDEAGQVPDNLPGLLSVTDLEVFERRMAYVRVAELEHDPAIADGDFTFETLREIHGWILQDVYPWAGQLRTTDTQAMGMAHCRPAFLADELHRVFGGITTDRPSHVDRESAIATTAHHWGELTGVHPFVDGNSRTQRVFFHRYLADARWDIDWRVVDAAAVHAARHVAMATTDSSFLAAELAPGVVRLGDTAPGSLAATQDTRDPARAVAVFRAMMMHRRAGGTAETFRAQAAAAGPMAGPSGQAAPSPPYRGRSEQSTSAPSRPDRPRGRGR